MIYWMAILRIEGYDRLIVRWWWLALGLAALMILLALWRLIVQLLFRYTKPRSNPKRLLHQLIRLHGLTHEERILVDEMAPSLPSGTYPAILFVDPGSWSWKRVNDAKSREAMGKMYTKIFGFPPDFTGT